MKEDDNKPASVIERWALDWIPSSSISQCSLCKHMQRGEKCPAFPEGIPKDFLLNYIIHNKPYPDDNGILYEARKEVDRDIQFKSLGKKV